MSLSRRWASGKDFCSLSLSHHRTAERSTWKPVMSPRLVLNPRWIKETKDSLRQMEHNCKVCPVLHAWLLNLTGKYLYLLASCKCKTNILSDINISVPSIFKQKQKQKNTPLVVAAPVRASQRCSLCSCASAAALHQEKPAVVSCGRCIGCKNLVVHVHKTTSPTLSLPRLCKRSKLRVKINCWLTASLVNVASLVNTASIVNCTTG